LPNSLEIPCRRHYFPSFIQQVEADALLNFIDAQDWDIGMRRRVQHYGWLYDYRATRVDSDSFLGPLPEALNKIAQAISELQGSATVFDQVIVNEYLPGQGISAHIDCLACFGPTVAAISLGSTCEMLFQNLLTKARLALILEPLSLLILAGEARSTWSHAIPARRSDVINSERRTRSRRVSLTFRTKN
jgi:alkylated DNA repair dioxygenase AlkB